MLPGRLGLRFALEALFLVLLAIGAGLADLRPALILVVMAVAWVLVAVVEFTAERIDASALQHLLPPRAESPEGEPEQVFWPSAEERTVVAPPERAPEPAPVAEAEAEPEPEPEPDPEPEPVAEAAPQVEEGSLEPPPRRRVRSFLRRRDRDAEPAPATPPRHVKLLPRRSAPQPSRASQDVAELFGASDGEDEPREEPGR
jgi:outer membrane biosynthesis protein TonB